MLKVYQIILDGAAGWITVKPDDFEIEIECTYLEENEKTISQGSLIKIMNNLRSMDIGDHIYFENMEFVCFEMEEDEFANLKEFTGW